MFWLYYPAVFRNLNYFGLWRCLPLLFLVLQYLVYAKMLLIKMKDLSVEGSNSCLSGTRSISWWLLRLAFLQQRILDERLSSLYDLLRVWMSETLRYFGNLDAISSYWGAKLHEGEALAILSTVHLEAGIVEHAYGRADSSRWVPCWLDTLIVLLATPLWVYFLLR